MSITNHVHHNTRIVNNHESQLVETRSGGKVRHDQPPGTHVSRKSVKAPFYPMCEAGFRRRHYSMPDLMKE